MRTSDAEDRLEAERSSTAVSGPPPSGLASSATPAGPPRRHEELEAENERLRRALETQSRRLRQVEQIVCPRDAVQVARLLTGLPPLLADAFDVASWADRTDFERRELPETLWDFWRSVVPPDRIVSLEANGFDRRRGSAWMPTPPPVVAPATAARPVTLLVLVWNHWETTRRCLESLLATKLDGAGILVVDNGSTDQTAEALAAYPEVEVLRLSENTGYVRGNNAGLAGIAADHDVVLLNNDLVFPDADWLRRLRASAYADPGFDVVGCRLRHPDGHLLHAGTFLLPDTMWGQQIGSLQRDVGQFAEDREVAGIVFACAYLKRPVLETLGGLSEDYVSYFEDTDFCLRARRRGFRVGVAGSCTLVHDEHGSTIGDDGTFRRIFERSRSVFADNWREELSRDRRSVLWQSILGRPTGYAQTGAEMIRALERIGVDCVYRYVYGEGSPFPLPDVDDLRDYLLNVARDRPCEDTPPVAVVYGQGDVFRRNRGRRKIGFTMLEVDRFPAEWVRQAAEMDAVWVPSEFNRRAFEDAGLENVEVVPLGVDPGCFSPEGLAIPNPADEFVFLANFAWGERKNPELLLRAFHDTFLAREPVRLVCKILNADPGVRWTEEIGRLCLRETGGRIDFLLNQEFPYYQMPVLYRSADCFVCASRGEGWNMPLMEAMACGLPTIATAWSAHRDFHSDAVGYPLRVDRLVAARARCPYYAGGRWAQADEEHLRHLLRHVFENREEAATRGRRAARAVRERWTWDHTARRIGALLADES